MGNQVIQGLRNWTPKRARSFANRRVNKMTHLLMEISYIYGDVDQSVVDACDDLTWRLTELEGLLDESLAEGRTL